MKPTIPEKSLIAEAGKTVSELLRKTIVSSAIMSSALEIPKFSELIKQKVFSDHFSGASGFRAFLDDSKLIVPIDPEKPGDMDKAFELISQKLAEQTAVNGEMVIAAAVVVLSHSTADDVFTKACELAVTLDRAKWLSELNLERTFSLRELHEKGANGIFAAELERFGKQLARKSLPARAELLFRHVPIVHNPTYLSTGPQHFRQSTLKEVDDLRISIVHGAALPRIGLQQSKHAMLFLHEAATTALRSLGFSYHLRFDPDVFLRPSPA